MSISQIFIWEDIKELLHEHDCVIVPGFGGFVCNREPARIDQVSHLITPPSRKVVFNQNLKSNDGLLAGYLAQKKQIAYAQAIQIIEDSVQQVLQLLQEKKQFAIDLFGSFRLNADANYVFLPDKRNNYLLSSYGLGLIQAEPVASRVVSIRPSRNLRSRKAVKVSKAQKNRWPKVLTGLLVLLLTINGYIFLQDHSLNDLGIGSNNTISMASWFDSVLNNHKTEPAAPPSVEQTENIVIPRPPVAMENLPAETADTIPEPSDVLDPYLSLNSIAENYAARTSVYFPHPPVEAVPSDAAGTVDEKTPVPIHINPAPVPAFSGSAKGYYVIGGVFCKDRNARRYLSLLNENGYTDAELLINQNIHCKRVSYKKFITKNEAEQFCSQIKSSVNPTAWVLAIEN